MEGYVNLYLKKNTSIKNLFSNVAAYSIHFTGPINITNSSLCAFIEFTFFRKTLLHVICVRLSVYMHNRGGQMAEKKI